MSAELLTTVGLASIMGSLHCAAMCGGLVGALGLGGGDEPRRFFREHAAFHFGRLASYATLGALAGALGSAIDLAGTELGVVGVASLLSGVLVLSWGLFGLLAAHGTWVPRIVAKLGVQRRLLGLLSFQSRRRWQQAAVLGLATALLPCGWLYAFVIAAAGTGGAASGALVMLAFWLGTVPALLGVGAVVGQLARPLRRHVPVLSAALMVLLGLGTIVHRTNIVGEAFASVDTAHARTGAKEPRRCH